LNLRRGSVQPPASGFDFGRSGLSLGRKRKRGRRFYYIPSSCPGLSYPCVPATSNSRRAPTHTIIRSCPEQTETQCPRPSSQLSKTCAAGPWPASAATTGPPPPTLPHHHHHHHHLLLLLLLLLLKTINTPKMPPIQPSQPPPPSLQAPTLREMLPPLQVSPFRVKNPILR